MKMAGLSVKDLKQTELGRLWQDFKSEGCEDARDKLILHYSPLVKYVAGRISANLPQSVESADLVSYGIFGLIDAIQKFDLGREIKFETYAMSRIKGSIIDELRALDWVPRSVRQKAKELENAYILLENKFKRVPTDEEVAEVLNVSIKELHGLLSQLSYTSVAALEELWSVGGDKDDKIRLIETVEDVNSSDPSDIFEFAETKEILAEAINRLPDREKTVIALYYHENLTLREIGEVLSVTESRVSQLHTKAIIRLKAKLRQGKTAIIHD
jgi:RNA polymerase sigma factor FliA